MASRPVPSFVLRRDNHDGCVVETDVRDELLAAADDPRVPLEHRRGPRRGRVRARPRLGEPESADLPPLRHGDEPLSLLRLRAEHVELLPDDACRDVQQATQRDVRPRDLLDAEMHPHPVPAASPVLWRKGDSHHAQHGHAIHDVVGVFPRGLHLFRSRCNDLIGKLSGHVPDHLLLFRETKIHTPPFRSAVALRLSG